MEYSLVKQFLGKYNGCDSIILILEKGKIQYQIPQPFTVKLSDNTIKVLQPDKLQKVGA